ncbi:phosphatidate cytidylyltransferase [Bacillus sp. B1-b2]|uniref:phosphatidate cytidylyltransferase n=1 Tax=Bacillus sp. B1-b2 TaxID=2653201 RepID=UPI001261F022|nr:phosphatidate cytidylyltransferase [Bacillus sp. B1-b2]KAB7668670.1 phosphatidate cytidylyltransferase [Bacillus sp. B1-b2]
MKQRIITAIIAIAIFLPVVLIGEVPLIIFTFFLAAIGIFEMFRMRKLPLLSFPGVLSIVTVCLLVLPGNDIGYKDISKVEVGLVVLLLLLSYMVFSKNRFTFDDVAYTALSVIYIGIGFHFFIQIREESLAYLVYSLFIIWATDSGAYFIGRALGKRKLWPDISPNKTVEGFIGGILCAILIGVLFNVFGYIEWSIGFIITTILLSIFGQIGDLAESALKRHYDVKDSGSLLPGHGGILDRFDSLIFVWPLLFFIFERFLHLI